MTTLCLKPKNGCLLWSSFNDAICRYQHDFDVDTSQCTTIIACCKDVLTAKDYVLKALGQKKIHFTDLPDSRQEHRRLLRLSHAYDFQHAHNDADTYLWIWGMVGLSFLILMIFCRF